MCAVKKQRQPDEMTLECKEISAQKLCAGTAPTGAQEAGGLYFLRHPSGRAKACDAAKLLSGRHLGDVRAAIITVFSDKRDAY